MDLRERFKVAARHASSGALGRLTTDQRLQLYGLYSIAVKRVAPSQAPSQIFDPVSFAKWSAWSALGDMHQDEAMERYLGIVAGIEAAARSQSRQATQAAELAKSASVPRGGDIEDTEDAASEDVMLDPFGRKASTGFDVVSEGDVADGQPVRKDICHWASVGNTAQVQQCIRLDQASVHFRDEGGLTALMRAADRNEVSIVRLLEQSGADLDARDAEGQSALHYAVYCDHAETAGLLVSCGARADVRDDEGLTATDAAAGDTLAAMQRASEGGYSARGRCVVQQSGGCNRGVEAAPAKESMMVRFWRWGGVNEAQGKAVGPYLRTETIVLTAVAGAAALWMTRRWATRK